MPKPNVDQDERAKGFFYIIPAKLVEVKNPTKGLLYGLITSLVNDDGFCWASNAYLARKLHRKSTARVSNYISELEVEGWIKTEVNPQKGNKRKIWIVNPIAFKSNRSCLERQDPYCLERQQSNISISNKKEYSLSVDEKENFFKDIYSKYPERGRLGRSEAFRRFKATIKNVTDIDDINKALKNYINHLNANKWKNPQNAKTWFNSWHDWVEYKSVTKPDLKTNNPASDQLHKIKSEIKVQLAGKADKESIKQVLWGLSENYWPVVKKILFDSNQLIDSVFNSAVKEIRDQVADNIRRQKKLLCPAR